MYVGSDGDDHGFIYDEANQQWIMIDVPGAVSTVPYGPTTGDATTGIIVVGSYKLAGSAFDNGFLYNAADGSYATINAPGATDTIPHSTYGNYVVGNYDTALAGNNDYANYPLFGNAFIYDMTTHETTTNDMPGAISTTAYGIWGHVIAGGYTALDGSAQTTHAYLYDMSSGDWYTFSHPGAVITHFDGITGGPTPDSYIVTGDYFLADGTEQAFSATIRNFTDIVWTDIAYPGATTTSGNSGYEDQAVGVYLNAGSNAVHGYVATLPCFAAGTRIATPDGEVPVEDLAPGMLVETRFCGVQPILWAGRRQVDCARHPDPARVWPVRVRAHAFGPNQPSRDLYLSPDHAIFSEGVLIPVKYLMDGEAVCQVQRSTVTYHHLELTQHDVLTSEGLATESLLPQADRSAFENGGGPMQLHPDFAHLHWDVAGCAPLRVTGPEVAAARARLARTARRASA